MVEGIAGALLGWLLQVRSLVLPTPCCLLLGARLQVRGLVSSAYERTLSLLQSKKELVEGMAQALLEARAALGGGVCGGGVVGPGLWGVPCRPRQAGLAAGAVARPGDPHLTSPFQPAPRASSLPPPLNPPDRKSVV